MIKPMKRGRPSIRIVVQSNLLQVLASSQTPLTTSSLTKFISKEVNRNLSWNTVQKYLEELVAKEEVQAINLPHSKIENRNGLTMYTLKSK